MDRCPICRATWNGGETCRRCRTDLSSVLATEQRAARLAGAAMQRLAAGDADGFRRLAERAHFLHATPETSALRALGQAVGDPSRARS